jgi:hypothetical protein
MVDYVIRYFLHIHRSPITKPMFLLYKPMYWLLHLRVVSAGTGGYMDIMKSCLAETLKLSMIVSFDATSNTLGDEMTPSACSTKCMWKLL